MTGKKQLGESHPGAKRYKKVLRALQVELVKLQKQVISGREKILVILEGRDAAGKDGVIKRIVRHLSPRETRVVAVGPPSDRERGSWYFQRFVPHLPIPQELVLFNRSWYNRAGVERVMGFCSEEQYEEFMITVEFFEQMLVHSGIRLFKYYLDISRDEQKNRLRDRRHDPLKQWKVSPIDKKALGLWDKYTRARNEMFTRTHHAMAPWTIVRADNKHDARLNLIRDLLVRLAYSDKNERILIPDPNVVFQYAPEVIEKNLIAP